jgi:hypothetical protein
MATKKKSKKTKKSKRTPSKKVKPVKRAAKKAPLKKRARKKKAATLPTKSIRATRSLRQTARRSDNQKNPAFELETGPDSAGQSGDLQGIRDGGFADSESVGELIEEGNAFEAGVVAGVERAGDDGEREVETHEVPEDDVPEEYLDKD